MRLFLIAESISRTLSPVRPRDACECGGRKVLVFRSTCSKIRVALNTATHFKRSLNRIMFRIEAEMGARFELDDNVQLKSHGIHGEYLVCMRGKANCPLSRNIR